MDRNVESRDPLLAQATESRGASLSATEIIGCRVENPAGEHIGKIKDFAIDVDQGRIAYAVLSFGGFLGMGDKLFALPWSALKLGAHTQRLILDVDKDTLEAAPGFDKDHWPDMADPAWGSEIHRYYGQQPYWEG